MYFYRDGYNKRKGAPDAETAYQALQEIRQQAGELTPEAVVTAAAQEDHPLHASFEWDDSEAARAYRLHQARQLIKAVVIREDEYSAPAYVSVRIDNSRRYEPVKVVSLSTEMKRACLKDYKARVHQLRTETGKLARYFARAEEIYGPLDAVQKTLDDLDPEDD